MELTQSKTQRILQYRDWLEAPGLSCSLARWLIDLFPKPQLRPFRDLLRDAAIAGTARRDIRMGQVSFYQPETARPHVVLFHTLQEVELLMEFGAACWLSVPASILRTAIMCGLPLPRVEHGVMSPTRTEQFTHQELARIEERAQILRSK